MSTQYLLKYFLNYQYLVLIGVLILSTGSCLSHLQGLVPDHHHLHHHGRQNLPTLYSEYSGEGPRRSAGRETTHQPLSYDHLGLYALIQPVAGPVLLLGSILNKINEHHHEDTCPGDIPPDRTQTYKYSYKGVNTKELIRLHGCAGWSVSLLFTYDINRFCHDDVAHKTIQLSR